MEKYNKPNMEIVKLETEDVITASGGGCAFVIPLNPDPVTPCESKDCSVYGSQW